MNNKEENKRGMIIAIIGGVLLVALAGYFMFTKKDEPGSITLSTGEEFTFPEGAADLNVTVLSIEGNEIVISRPSVTLTPEEQAAARAERQAMTQEERQASRLDRNAEREMIEETIIIPIGVPMIKNKVLDVDDPMYGIEGSRNTLSKTDSGLGDPDLYESATLADIVEGSSLSIWKEDDSIILIRVKGGNR